MRRVRVIGAIIFLLIAILGSIIYLQKKLTCLSKAYQPPPSMSYLPESEKIKPWLLGFHTAVADFLWIKTTIYFGSHLIGNRQYPWLVQMVDIVTRLNPAFYPAYEFGGLLIPETCHNPLSGRLILERGVCQSIGKKWKFYFYLGMLHYEYYNDCEKAAICCATAAQLPGAPIDKLMSLANHFYNKSFGSFRADQFLTFLYNTSENPEVKRYLLEKIKKSSTDGNKSGY